MNKNWKRLLSLAIGVCFLLSGCGGKENGKQADDEKKKENVAMGRYIEKDIEQPPLSESDKLINYYENLDGAEEAFVVNYTTKEACRYVRKQDGSWEKQEAKWLSNANILTEEGGGSITYVNVGQDGNYYCLYMDIENQNRPYLIKSADGETVEEILMEGFDQFMPGRDYYPYVERFAVNANGDIAVSYYNTVKLYHADGSSYGYEWDTGNQGATLAITNDEVLFVSGDEAGIVGYSIATGSQTRELPFDANQNNQSCLAIGEEGAIYMMNSGGIYRVVQGGTTWENIVDGGLTSLAMPTLYNGKLVLGDHNDFFVQMNGDDDTYHFMQYVYDETVSAEPSVELSVYSLEDSATIRQAAVEYQRNHTDVRVSFRVAMGEDSGTTAEDNIRALNTELLNHKGADIIVLDGMPIDSYIEKGVLEDISDVIQPMLAEGTLLENIIKNSEINGQYYAVPIHLGLLVYIGETEAVNAAGSVSDLAAYAEKTKEPLFGAITQKAFTREMFKLSSNELLQEDGSLNQAAFTSFLQDVQTISSYMDIQEEGNPRYEVFNELRLLNHDGKMVLSEFDGLNSTIWSFSLSNYIDCIVKSAENLYVPKTIIGINHATQNMEEAKGFMRVLLSEAVQSSDLYEGFPVNSNALDRWNSLEKEMAMSMSATDDDGNMTSMDADWPNEENRKLMNKFCREATMPVKMDQVLLEMILGETDAFFAGEKSAEETALAVAEKTKAYLAE